MPTILVETGKLTYRLCTAHESEPRWTSLYSCV